MNILITGASGLVGAGLGNYFTARGDRVFGLARDSDTGPFRWQSTTRTCFVDPSIRLDVVINLAGEASTGRWTPAKKRAMHDTRVELTRALVTALANSATPPRLLVSASAVGFYGDNGDREVHEESPGGDDFLATLAQDWEHAAAGLRAAGTRVVLARLGMVLSRRGGALREMLLPFRLGLGGRVGSGNQYWSWVSTEELAALVEFIIGHETLSGPVNLVAPQAVTNAEFAHLLGRALKRPAVLPLPAFAARLLFGEMADAMLLTSIRAQPRKLLAAGYAFRFPTLPAALASLLR